MEKNASVLSARAPPDLGVTLKDGGADVAVFSHFGERVWFCQFDADDDDGAPGPETGRWRLSGRDGDIHYGFVPGVTAGQHYGLRADGPYDPARGHRFDPLKLLADPYARAICEPFTWRPELAAPREAAIDTAAFVPRSIVTDKGASAQTRVSAGRRSQPPEFIYEVAVRTFTRTRPDVPKHLRGTLAGLAQPQMIDYLHRLGVSHVELMPVTAWIDERHLAAPGLTNVWGYNPVLYMALDPRLAGGGMAELRAAVNALHAADIGVLLDVVFNHTGESDEHGAVLSLRGLDNAVYYRHAPSLPASLINDTGCGNTLATGRAPVLRLMLDSLRYFAVEAGIDGFRFDLAVTTGRTESGFTPDAPVLAAIAQDPVLRNLTMIAEPWDLGPGGYQLGRFPPSWHEWNDTYRDGVRRFWHGDSGAAGEFATRISGSADLFQQPGRGPAASINFVAAHDGFALRDCVSYEQRHNHANGEDNRDGHGENHSWNCGHEGETDDRKIRDARQRDIRALLATLFLSRGTPMLTAGDEFGRTQRGNNNAYAQDNALTWLDWEQADDALRTYTAALAAFRKEFLAAGFNSFLSGEIVALPDASVPDVSWWRSDGEPMQGSDWFQTDQIAMTLVLPGLANTCRLHAVFNRGHAAAQMTLPTVCAGRHWRKVLDSASGQVASAGLDSGSSETAAARSVCAWLERGNRA